MPVLWLLPCRAVPCSPHAYSAILARRHPKRAAASPSTLWEDCHNNGGMGTGLLCVHMRGRSLPNPEPVDVPVHRCVCAEHMTAARAAHAGPGPVACQVCQAGPNLSMRGVMRAPRSALHATLPGAHECAEAVALPPRRQGLQIQSSEGAREGGRRGVLQLRSQHPAHERRQSRRDGLPPPGGSTRRSQPPLPPTGWPRCDARASFDASARPSTRARPSAPTSRIVALCSASSSHSRVRWPRVTRAHEPRARAPPSGSAPTGSACISRSPTAHSSQPSTARASQ
jgi:hypothetical protein